MNHIKDNLKKIQEAIKVSVEKSGRSPSDITLIGVTKYVSIGEALELANLGIEDFGENRIDEATKKLEALSPRRVHFIGNVQTNKVNKIVGKFHSIHSLDRESLIDAVEKRAASLGIKQRGFLQINISGEKSKGGFFPEDLPGLVDHLKNCPHIEIEGLMTMAPQGEKEAQLRQIFGKLKSLAGKNGYLNLSMGMSGDFEIALEEGATHIRIGSRLFQS